MKIEIIERLITTPISRNTNAPWLRKRSNKVRLVKDFIIKVKECEDRDDFYLVIPKGYIGDWASIPRLFWLIYPPNYSEARNGAMVHDYIYSHLHYYFDRRFADELLKAFMEHDKSNRLAKWCFYYSVRIGGRGGWKQRTRRNPHPHWLEKFPLIHYDG